MPTTKEHEMKTRNLLYIAAKAMGDMNAAKGGTVIKRLQRRALGRITGKWLIRKLIKRK